MVAGRTRALLSHVGWGHDGRSRVRTPELSLGQPVKLFDDAGYAHITGARSYDSTKDGRFLITKVQRPSGTSAPGSLVIVQTGSKS